VKRTIRRSRVYPHPVERLWAALTTSEALAAWLMPNDFEPRVGHAFQLVTDPAPGFDGIVHCEVLELEAPRRMVWSWRGGPVDTTVTFEVQPTPDGARLDFTQTGFEGPRGLMVSVILENGFAKMVRVRLPAVLDRLAAGAPPAAPDAPRSALGARLETWVARLFARKEL
jgi:uncharacterized protein YndB with AHSA1/START domain